MTLLREDCSQYDSKRKISVSRRVVEKICPSALAPPPTNPPPPPPPHRISDCPPGYLGSPPNCFCCEEDSVNCGDHRAKTCELCPLRGEMVRASWCQGDCSWRDGKCSPTPSPPAPSLPAPSRQEQSPAWQG